MNKVTVTIDNHNFFFLTRDKDVSKLTEVWSRHCSHCCSSRLTDVQLFSHHLINAKVTEYCP